MEGLSNKSYICIMSTRIYNGVKFKTTNWTELMSWLVETRSKITNIIPDIIDDHELYMFIRYNDMSGSEPWDIRKKIFYSCDSHRIGEFNFPIQIGCSVWIYPDSDGIYGYYFDSNRDGYRKVMEWMWEDFSYWNSSDGPEDISEEEWRARGKKWDGLIPKSVGDRGFYFNFVDSSSERYKTESVVQSRIVSLLESVRRDIKLDKCIE
jgi:hypothetical protein